MRFQGIFVPMATFFDEQGALNYPAQDRQIEFLLGHGVHGLFTLGTTGEFAHLSPDERREFGAHVVRRVAGRVPVILNTGTTSTADSIALSRHAREIGADAIALVAPYYWTLNERQLLAHFSAVAGAVNLPVVLYNFPAYTGVHLSPELVLTLMRDCPNVIGVKDTIDSVTVIRHHIMRLRAENPAFSVFAGGDDHLLNVLAMGGAGTIPATANFAPALHVAAYEAFRAGEYEAALAGLQAIMQMANTYAIPGGASALVKQALVELGLSDAPYVRPPALPLTDEARAQLRAVLSATGLLAGAAVA